MKPEERDRIWLRFIAVWPSPRMSEPTELVWLETFTPMNPERALRALNSLTRQESHRPSIAKFTEAYDAQPGAEHILRAPECGICDDGWILGPCGRDDCSRPYCAVTACPNGCKPMTRAQREMKYLTDLSKPKARRGMQEQNQALR